MYVTVLTYRTLKNSVVFPTVKGTNNYRYNIYEHSDIVQRWTS
jgi:hypothetical protein